jgi:hypothetical protein
MIVTSIGVLGALLILGCFVANELNAVNSHSFIYDAGNVLGSVLLIAYAYLIGSWPFLVLNLIWALVALRDLFSSEKSKRNSLPNA